MNMKTIFNLNSLIYTGIIASFPILTCADSLKIGGGIQTDFAWFDDQIDHPMKRLGYGSNNLSFDNQSNVTAAELTVRGRLVKNFVYNLTVNHNVIERFNFQRSTYRLANDGDFPPVFNRILGAGPRRNLLVRDAWVGWDMMDPWVRFSLGRMNVQQGLENTADHSSYTFIAPAAGQRSFMVGRADGISFEGNPFKFFGYQAGAYYYTRNASAFGGVPGSSVNTDESSQVVVSNLGNHHSMYNGRVFLQPLVNPGKVVHLGGTYSYVNTTGDVTLNAAPGGYFNLSNSKLIGLSTANGSAAARDVGGFKRTDGYRLWGVEALGILGPWHVQSEYYDYKVDLVNLAAGSGITGVKTDNAGNSTKNIKASGYYVQASWLLTGETRHYDPVSGTLGKVKPINKYGAWEVAGRWDKVDFAKTVNVTGRVDAPVIFCGNNYRANAGIVNNYNCNNGGEMTDWTVGLNWYPNSNVKLMANYTSAEGKYAKADDGLGPEFADVLRNQPSSRHANRRVNVLVAKGQVSF